MPIYNECDLVSLVMLKSSFERDRVISTVYSLQRCSVSNVCLQQFTVLCLLNLDQ